MELFCYHRDRPGSVALREELLEERWSYMDRYASQMSGVGELVGGHVHAHVQRGLAGEPRRRTG